MNYWGQPDGTIDFCEENYKENMYIAEYWNTLSASIYFLIGMMWISTKYKKIAMCFMFLSVATALWHGTLRYWGQWSDEVGMFVLSFNLIKNIHPSMSNNWLVLLIAIYFAFQDLFFIFGGLFVVLQIYIGLCAKYITKQMNNNRDMNLYGFLGILSGIVWLLDTFFCEPSGINYHSIWHITTGLLGHVGMRIMYKYDNLNLKN